MLEKILPVVQIISSVLLIVAVLLQNREGGASGVLGGDGVGGSFYTKRGMEKSLIYATVIFAIFFVGSSVLSFL